MKHGMNNTPTHNAWVNMRQRCSNHNRSDYQYYGGRGITTCNRWKSFKNFFVDMGPSNGLTLDRVDNDGNYEPENCRWATMGQQSRNKRIYKINKYGISSVYKYNNKWFARIGYKNKNLYLYEGNDFFEACCRRKSAENKYWRNENE